MEEHWRWLSCLSRSSSRTSHTMPRRSPLPYPSKSVVVTPVGLDPSALRQIWSLLPPSVSDHCWGIRLFCLQGISLFCCCRGSRRVLWRRLTHTQRRSRDALLGPAAPFIGLACHQQGWPPFHSCFSHRPPAPERHERLSHRAVCAGRSSVSVPRASSVSHPSTPFHPWLLAAISRLYVHTPPPLSPSRGPIRWFSCTFHIGHRWCCRLLTVTA